MDSNLNKKNKQICSNVLIKQVKSSYSVIQKKNAE